MKVQDSVAGTGMVLITRLFKEANIPFTARPTSNYSRALLDLSHGEADGFFQAAKTLERDAVADYLQIGINAWSWYFLKDSKADPLSPGFKTSVKVGTVLNSSQQAWLLEHGYPVHSMPVDAIALVKMLQKGRIDAAFTSEDVFCYSIPKAGFLLSDFRVAPGVKLPTGLYMSKAWTKANPGLWKRLKAAAKTLPNNQ